ncbi:hypothetical protein BDZ97DRAFT_1904608 [Flammula alnicola]|nr:hypothetical protein BDZ97DRAFT_1904608 [Flammula alnicola]
MNSTVRKILVVGGNGFIGSAVCKAALARGTQVISVRPYRTPKGHSPAWTFKVDWQQGDALHPQSFAHLFPQVDGVVHTLGTLIENSSYKHASFHALCDGGGNPLEKQTPGGNHLKSYETMNRDSALRVCEAFLSSPAGEDPSWNANKPRPFVYISAEDIFRPVIPARYIETKREAERGIEQMMVGKSDYRGVYMRPSLVYHAHLRPLTTPAAAYTPIPWRASLGCAFFFRYMGSTSALESIANALSIPPIHVDHVAEAICVALDSRNDVRGVVGVSRMRQLIGWSEDGRAESGMGFAGA